MLRTAVTERDPRTRTVASDALGRLGVHEALPEVVVAFRMDGAVEYHDAQRLRIAAATVGEGRRIVPWFSEHSGSSGNAAARRRSRPAVRPRASAAVGPLRHEPGHTKACAKILIHLEEY